MKIQQIAKKIIVLALYTLLTVVFVSSIVSLTNKKEVLIEKTERVKVKLEAQIRKHKMLAR